MILVFGLTGSVSNRDAWSGLRTSHSETLVRPQVLGEARYGCAANWREARCRTWPAWPVNMKKPAFRLLKRGHGRLC